MSTTTAMPRITNMTTPASFGVEWSEGASTYQLVNPRGTRCLLLGIKGERDWLTTTVVDTDRFMDRIPRTWAEFHRVLEAWFAGTEDPS